MTQAQRIAMRPNRVAEKSCLHRAVHAQRALRHVEDVLDFYGDVDSRRGNDRNANVSRDQLDPLLRQLRGVDDDAEYLLAFLGALSDGSFDRTTPRRVPSGLAVGGRIR